MGESSWMCDLGNVGTITGIREEEAKQKAEEEAKRKAAEERLLGASWHPGSCLALVGCLWSGSGGTLGPKVPSPRREAGTKQGPNDENTYFMQLDGQSNSEVPNDNLLKTHSKLKERASLCPARPPISRPPLA